ncbi:MAG: hypothetical protein ACTSVV_17000 [Promethearchaeota archaeon]
MKIFKDMIDHIKNKKDLIKELKIYKEFIQKKLDIEDLNSALSKVRSALTLIKEYQDKFDIEDEIKEFNSINDKITSELKKHRDFYLRKFNNLLKEKVNENNLENLLKLLAMLKSDIDKVYEKYNLHDLQADINRYFTFIKRLYIILTSYETLNYHKISEIVYNYMKDLENENFPNLENLIQTINLKIIIKRLKELSEKYEKMKIQELSEDLLINEEDLIDIIISIMDMPENPIRVYNSTNREVIFNRNLT